MEDGIKLNLAREWRPRSFGEVVGQPLAVQLLANSLRQGLIFPAYLLAGLRGSGKTSMGRIFAGAINCQGLESFRSSREGLGSFPCLSCASCLAMKRGDHPDFIEIDAASHTGVDNVRQIIEEAAFLPVLGQRKVYLIDEVHMLSKAAFNAFLKILEEPPKTVLFLLATTDPHKVIETVRSRSFQIFFDPIPLRFIVEHLVRVCSAEQIVYEEAALWLIARESEGSLRDALNMVERARLTTDGLTVRSMTQVLGFFEDVELIELVKIVARADTARMLAKMREMRFGERSAMAIWERLLDLVRALIWALHDLPCEAFVGSEDAVRSLSKEFTLGQLLEFLDLLYRTETQFLRTTAQHILIERVLCTMAQRCAPRGNAEEVVASLNQRSRSVPSVAQRPVPEMAQVPQSSSVLPVAPSERSSKRPEVVVESPIAGKKDSGWVEFLNGFASQGDPMLCSILRQGVCVSSHEGVVNVCFPKKFAFYQELLVSNRDAWQPYLERVFGEGVTLVSDFSGADGAQEPRIRQQENPSPSSGVVNLRESGVRAGAPKSEARDVRRSVDVSDGTQWKRAQELLGLFPGTISEIKENHE